MPNQSGCHQVQFAFNCLALSIACGKAFTTQAAIDTTNKRAPAPINMPELEEPTTSVKEIEMTHPSAMNKTSSAIERLSRTFAAVLVLTRSTVPELIFPLSMPAAHRSTLASSRSHRRTAQVSRLADSSNQKSATNCIDLQYPRS